MQASFVHSSACARIHACIHPLQLPVELSIHAFIRSCIQLIHAFMPFHTMHSSIHAHPFDVGIHSFDPFLSIMHPICDSGVRKYFDELRIRDVCVTSFASLLTDVKHTNHI
jgi:hypothetical protein